MKSLWNELNIEEEHLAQDPYGAVDSGNGNWVGSRIYFKATLQLISWGGYRVIKLVHTLIQQRQYWVH